MKQNQNLYRPFPHQNPTLKPKIDFLNCKLGCKCKACSLIVQINTPQIQIDKEKNLLITLANKQGKISDLVIFLDQYRKVKTNLPHFPFLDTIVLKNGQLDFMIHNQKNRVCVQQSTKSIKTFVMEKKKHNDLQYQKKKYLREHEGFTFTQLDHQSQKLIKQFENKIQFLSSLLNRVVIIKVYKKQQQQILNMSDFKNLFDKNKVKSYSLNQIEYIQIFPIMAGEEQQSYVKQIKYFRNKEFNNQNFKLAQYYFSTWCVKNQTQSKSEQSILQKIKQSQEQLLMYYTYKLMIHFEYISKIRINSACVYYITNDKGKSFFFKNINYISAQQLVRIQQLNIKQPTIKNRPLQNHIQLNEQMDKYFNQYQKQYEKLQVQQLKRQQQLQSDKNYSQHVYETITKVQNKNFHQVILSPSKKYKKQFLKLE